jgi:hypothetical protein
MSLPFSRTYFRPRLTIPKRPTSAARSSLVKPSPIKSNHTPGPIKMDQTKSEYIRLTFPTVLPETHQIRACQKPRKTAEISLSITFYHFFLIPKVKPGLPSGVLLTKEGKETIKFPRIINLASRFPAFAMLRIYRNWIPSNSATKHE